MKIKHIAFALFGLLLVGQLACYLDVNVQCLSNTDCVGGAVCEQSLCVCKSINTESVMKLCPVTGGGGFSCADTQTSAAHCGSCGQPCNTGEICKAGKCQQCDTTNNRDASCGGTCVDLTTDSTNCGACNNTCASPKVCVPKAGKRDLPAVQLTKDDVECGCPGTNGGVCSGKCVDLDADTDNCGSCNTKCDTGSGEVCVAGKCDQCKNKTDHDLCDINGKQVCKDLANDASHCGACGTKCAADEVCCGKACVKLGTADNCSKCGDKCGADQACNKDPQDATKFACGCKEAGKELCAGTCVELTTDAKHCGTCGNACGANQVCAHDADAKNTACCGQDTPDRCGENCRNLQADPNNCGKCGNTCQAGEACIAGKCGKCTKDADCGANSPLTCNNGACECGPGCSWLYHLSNTSAQANSESEGRAIAVDGSGNVYLTGVLKSTAIFGTGVSLKGKGDRSVFVAKFDPAGKLSWAKVFGSPDDSKSSEGQGIAVSADGKKVYVTGYFVDKLEAGTVNLTSNGAEDIFLLELDDQGTVLQGIAAGSSGSDKAFGITLDKNGNVYLTGEVAPSPTFPKTTPNKPGNHKTKTLFYALFEPANKGFKEAVLLDSDGSYGRYIVVKDDGTIAITGECGNNPVTVQQGSTSICSTAAHGFMIIEYKSGTAQPTNGTSALGPSVGYGLTLLSNKVMAAGSVSQSADFSGTILSTPGLDIVLTSLGAAKFDFVTVGGGKSGSDTGIANGIAAAASNLFLTGWYSGTVPFDTHTQTSAGDRDIFVARADASGKWTWSISAGGSKEDQALAITSGKDGSIFVTGFVTGGAPVDFPIDTSGKKTTHTPAGAKELFVWKIPRP